MSSPVRYSPAAMAGCAVTALVCLGVAVQCYSLESSYQQQNPDPYMVSAQATRMAALFAAVPENAVLGYISDAKPGSTTDSVLLGTAQYTLAPRLLTRGTGPELVLGNFTRPADFAAFGASQGLRLQQDFGNGVVLYRKSQGAR